MNFLCIYFWGFFDFYYYCCYKSKPQESYSRWPCNAVANVECADNKARIYSYCLQHPWWVEVTELGPVLQDHFHSVRL